MKSKQYPYEVYVLRKRVNISSESSQLYSDEAVNQIRTGRQVLKNKAQKESTIFRKRQAISQTTFKSDVKKLCRPIIDGKGTKNPPYRFDMEEVFKDYSVYAIFSAIRLPAS